jgi:hypothetical protein
MGAQRGAPTRAAMERHGGQPWSSHGARRGVPARSAREGGYGGIEWMRASGCTVDLLDVHVGVGCQAEWALAGGCAARPSGHWRAGAPPDGRGQAEGT